MTPLIALHDPSCLAGPAYLSFPTIEVVPDLEEATQGLRAHSVENGAVEDDGDDCSDGCDDHGHDEHAAHASDRKDRESRVMKTVTQPL